MYLEGEPWDQSLHQAIQVSGETLPHLPEEGHVQRDPTQRVEHTKHLARHRAGGEVAIACERGGGFKIVSCNKEVQSRVWLPTYSCNHCACEKEGVAEIPVAGVGWVARGIHATLPGIQNHLQTRTKRQRLVYTPHQCKHIIFVILVNILNQDILMCLFGMYLHLWRSFHYQTYSVIIVIIIFNQISMFTDLTWLANMINAISATPTSDKCYFWEMLFLSYFLSLVRKTIHIVPTLQTMHVLMLHFK